MPLSTFMTQTASTKRHPAKSGIKVGDPVTNLSSLSITPLMISNSVGMQQVRATIGLEGTAVQIWETYTESHTHTDSGVEVTQLPDIIAGDKLVIGSTTYDVKWCEAQPATTGLGATLIVYVTEDKRA